MGSSLASATDQPLTSAARESIVLSARERDYLLRSVISSQALEGVHISYEEAERLLEDVLRRPLPSLD
jgi:hypothetical protein